MPAVRALAKKLGVDLARVAASGAGGVVTLADVKAAAERGTAKAGAAPAAAARPAAYAAPASPPPPAARAAQALAPRDATVPYDADTPIRGVRRNMLRVMSEAHAQVVPTTLMDDADI